MHTMDAKLCSKSKIIMVMNSFRDASSDGEHRWTYTMWGSSAKVLKQPVELQSVPTDVVTNQAIAMPGVR